ncbi:MAG: hydantoinase [Rhodospirillaceae bacterium]|jgi:N-methylhydantoinase A|uniref:hydantoinase/oxoprolinase family protein n=1 Tax=Hwanghaeella sp. 1Z406 TaxID=3402811 RepID=UPI000C5EF435|nr:hydantoinase [Rhodospirillales bacterium]MAX48975.1 hydantoinase [Rhodospirillaceae bacterium]|tara:strand:- start:67181 stop:69223 length:2043 start_codon:yes stop_codon:yes gene_type:complete
MTKIVGCDVGGTFTDLIYLDEATGGARIAKVPTTVANQSQGVLSALDKAQVDITALDSLVHGTTATTNALLERKLAKTGLITTAGFRDILELGRRTRPSAYGLTGSFTPLIPRNLRMEVPERMDVDGNVVIPLDEEAVKRAAESLVAEGCESLLIHFLHSYTDPTHEKRAKEIALSVWPNAYVTAGHEILSEFREYERGVTAAVNAAVQPILERYLARLTKGLSQRGYTKDLLVMQGNGGTVSAEAISKLAVNTVMSGPASGVMAAARTGSVSGRENLITFDMGGTSCDVGLIKDGTPQVSSELEIEYAMPVHVPMVDVHTIGAGGGSIARIDAGGLLQVGPESAGAQPGPICYGRGGTEPTITDANLVLGRLNQARLLAVEGAPDIRAIQDRIAAVIGEPLGLSWEAAAAAILRIANDRMAGAVRMVSLSRGHDPRDFSLFAFGGAGPLHAGAIARELGVPTLLIPARPGITNALGCAVADLRHDFVNTINKPMASVDMSLVRDTFEAQIAEGRARLDRDGGGTGAVRVIHTADMQFIGQSHLLSVPIADPAISREDLQAAFEAVYWARFEVALPEIKANLVNLNTAVIGIRQQVDLRLLLDPVPADVHPESRPVWFEEGGWTETPILQRATLSPGTQLFGPAIVEQMDTTTVLAPGMRVEVDEIGNMIVHVGPGGVAA